jgi:hypothetical protein
MVNAPAPVERHQTANRQPHDEPSPGPCPELARHELALPRWPSIAPVVRCWVRSILDSCPRIHDAEQLAAELTADSIRHGHWNGFVVVLITEPDRLRLAVTEDDQAEVVLAELAGGQPDEPEATDAHAYGFQLINTVADRWGHAYPQSRHETLWAELDW